MTSHLRFSPHSARLLLAALAFGLAGASSAAAVPLLPQTLNFTSLPPTTATIGGGYNPIASGGGSVNPVIYSIDAASTAGACTYTGGLVHFTGNGKCIVDANKAGDATYAAAPQVQQSIKVGKTAQTISFTTTAPGFPSAGTTYHPAAKASSGLFVTLSLDAASGSACTFAKGVITITAPGSCIIDANQQGTADFSAAPQAQQTILIQQSNTATAVTSSAATARLGQPVTFTATVTEVKLGAASLLPSVGTVTFKNGTANLCLAVPLAKGQATCTISFAAAAPVSVTAIYSGGGTLGGSSSSALAQAVYDQGPETVQAIGSFLARRNQLIADNEPDAGRQISRLAEAGPEAANASEPARAPHFASSPAQGFALSGEAEDQGAARVNFSTSLSQIARFAADTQARKDADAPGAGFAGASVPSAAPRYSPWDLWAEGKYAGFRSGDLDGHIGLVSAGADYVFGSRLLVGVMGQFDSMTQTSAALASKASGQGWLAGPYATVRLTDNLYWQARGGFGASLNDISPSSVYIDHVVTQRWLASTSLTGRWTRAGWSFDPALSVTYIEDVAKAHYDPLGIAVPEIKSRLGSARLGPEVGYRIQASRDLALEPHAGVQLIWNFANAVTAAGFEQAASDAAGPSGARGRVDAGLSANYAGGYTLDVSGSYDGLGAAGYSAVAGRADLRVPLN